MSNTELKIGKYKHYKGKFYEVISIATHSETLEKLVVYKQLYGNYSIWVRPYTMFIEQVKIDGEWLNRFDYIPNEG